MYSESNSIDTLNQIQNLINIFNNNNEIKLYIDTIRIDFSKQHKLPQLNSLGNWNPISKNSPILPKLKKRLEDNEITSVYQLEEYDIYFYCSNKDRPKYRTATMIIFSMKQYHKEPPPNDIIISILNILTFGVSKNSGSVDICYDIDKRPNIKNFEVFFDIKQYTTHQGIKTETYYINDLSMGNITIEKVCIYNKSKKNHLKKDMYRFEATIRINNYKALELPLEEFKSIIEIGK